MDPDPARKQIDELVRCLRNAVAVRRTHLWPLPARRRGGLGTSCYHAEMMSVRKIEVLLFDCGYSFRLMRGAPCRRSWRDGLDEVIDIHTDDVVVNSLR